MADGHVVKRFRSWDRGEPEREWRALNVLAEFAPALAPAPLSAHLDAALPAAVAGGTFVPGPSAQDSTRSHTFG